jgi:hypothetical protein
LKKLLKPSVISDVGALLENAHDLLTPKFVNETTQYKKIIKHRLPTHHSALSNSWIKGKKLVTSSIRSLKAL